MEASKRNSRFLSKENKYNSKNMKMENESKKIRCENIKSS